MLRTIFYSFTVAALIFSALTSPGKAYAEDILFNDSPAIENESLAEMRGTALSPEVLGIAIFEGMSANNTSSGTVSGGNVIGGGAFSQSSGLSTIIQNSGNNVLIQSATILNVNMN